MAAADPPPDGGKVLILTVAHGAAHQRVAHALEKALTELQPGLVVKVVDALEHCARWFRAYYNSYEIPLKYWPALWGWIEKFQHNSSSTGPKWLYHLGGKPLFQFIHEFDPDVVIATEVGLSELAAIMKRKWQCRFGLVGAITGLDVDLAWAQQEVDLHIVALNQMRARLEAFGVSREKVLACGQPIDPAFGSAPDRARLRRRLKVEPDVPLLLILFGGAGHGRPRPILQGLGKLAKPVQVVFITGRNRRLEESLQEYSNGNPRCRVFGWVDNVHEWMAVADLLISKPGAATVMEALNSGLPLLTVDPLPGNERRACDWIERHGVGHWVRRPEELAPTIARLLASPGELHILRRNALAAARPHAAREAAQAILKLCPC